MTHKYWIACVTLALLLSGCSTPAEKPDGQETPAPGQLVQSDKPRNMSPVVPAGDLDELVAGNNAFAWDLYQQVRDQPGNVFYSPYSISIALAMTYAGARTQTEQAMAQTLHYTLPQARLHAAFNQLDLLLASRATTAQSDGEGFQFHIVNRLWGQTGFSFLADFLDTLAENYGAGLSLLDFLTDPDGSRVVINDWVAEQTAQRIKDLIPPGDIDAFTRLVLTNAIYFKASWEEQFEESATQDAPFHLLDGSDVTVRMMHQQTHFGYAAGDGYEALELPYVGSQLSMVILLPKAGQFGAFEGTLDAQRVKTIIASPQWRTVDLSLPKFTFEWHASLKDLLAALGMGIAFDGLADFSGMNGGDPPLAIHDVVHKAFVAVDEQGTEAAAATAVIVGPTSAMPEEPVTVRIDRPFLFVIRDRDTDTLLFVGRVLNPGT